jgi:hypothetical protein
MRARADEAGRRRAPRGERGKWIRRLRIESGVTFPIEGELLREQATANAPVKSRNTTDTQLLATSHVRLV